ncbi:MAG: outer membrane protein assembly factor BamB [Pseudomonadota bacterium]
MKLRVAVLLVASLGLTGCSGLASWAKSKSEGTMPAELTEFKPSATVEVRWQHSIGSGEGVALQPAVTREAVYAANAKGQIFRIDRNTGKETWHADAGFPVSGGVGTGEGLVFVGSAKGDVAAFDDQGKLRWKAKVSSEVLVPPQAADGIVVVRTGDGKVTGLSVADGKRQWLYERMTPALVVRSQAGVVIERGTVYTGFAGGKLAAIGLNNGSLLWEAVVSQPRGNTELERISDITSNPVLDDEQVCAIAFQGRLACFDPMQGNALWVRDLSGDKGLALLRRSLYITDSKGAVLAMDKGAGSSLWKNDRLLYRQTSAPFALDSYVLVGDLEGYVHVLSREDGAFAARLKTDGSPILTAPVALGTGVLVQTSGGGLYSIVIK